MEYMLNNPIIATQFKIRKAISDMGNGIGNKRPFAIGAVEKRMSKWAKENNVELGSQSLYMSEYSIQHSLREDKEKKGLSVSPKELEDFPIRRYSMDLYYDNNLGNFNYVDLENQAKYIVEPTYKVKLFRGEKVIIVAHITAQRLSIEEAFTDTKRYIKI